MTRRSARRAREAAMGKARGAVYVDERGEEMIGGAGDGCVDGADCDGGRDDGQLAVEAVPRVPGTGKPARVCVVLGRRRGVAGDEELGDVLRHIPALMSPAELAALTGMHVGSIRRGITEGRIPADKVNGRWCIPAALLLRNSYRCLDGAEAAGGMADDAMAAMRERRMAEIDDAEAEVERAELAERQAARRAERARERAEIARLGGGRGRRRASGDGDEGIGGALCRA